MIQPAHTFTTQTALLNTCFCILETRPLGCGGLSIQGCNSASMRPRLLSVRAVDPNENVLRRYFKNFNCMEGFTAKTDCIFVFSVLQIWIPYHSEVARFYRLLRVECVVYSYQWSMAGINSSMRMGRMRLRIHQ